MKKTSVLLLAVLVAGSCSDIGIPASVTVKGNPGLYVPLGKISEIQGGVADVAKFVSKDEIRNMVSDPAENGRTMLYDYAPPGTTAITYLIRFQIADMKLDFSEYVKTDVSIPEIRFENPLDQPLELPPVPIDLKDMGKLVKSLEGTQSGITIQNLALKDSLEVKIPALGIPDYIRGTPDGSSLAFLGGDFTLRPQTGTIEMFIRLTGKCPQTGIAPQMTLDWTKAKIDTSGNSPLAGAYPLDMSGLMKSLGPGVTFKQAKGYLYITGIETGKVSLGLNHTDLVSDKDLEPKPTPRFSPDTPEFQGLLPEDSITDNPFIDLTEAFTADKKELSYTIKIDEMHITKENSAGKAIAVDLVVELPLEFSVANTVVEQEGKRYVKLDLGNGILPKGNGTDIFGRSPNAKNDFFNDIQDVAIKIKNIENTFFPISLLIAVKSRSEIVQLFSDTGSIPDQTIALGTTPNPFSPKFEILLPIKDGESTGTLTLQRAEGEPKFDFFLAAEAKAGIEITQTF